MEVFTRLARKGYRFRLVSYELHDWPAGLPLHWTRIPGRRLPTHLLRVTWFFLCANLCALWLRFRHPDWILVTLGVAVPTADVRVVHFLNSTFGRMLRHRRTGSFGRRSPLHVLYQAIFSWENTLLERWFLGKSRALICVSKRIADEVLECLKGRPVPSLSVIPHGIPQDRPQSSVDARMSSRVLFVGALERKGIDKALRIAAKLKDLPWSFEVLGSGDLAYWKQYATRLGIIDRVVFLGVRPAAPHFAKAAVFLFPSYYEPYGMVVSEAASAGVVPLCSMECGAMEAWPECPSWLKLSAFDSDEEWADALRKLLTSEELRERLGREAREAFSRWTWDDCAAEYARVLEAVRESKAS